MNVLKNDNLKRISKEASWLYANLLENCTENDNIFSFKAPASKLKEISGIKGISKNIEILRKEELLIVDKKSTPNNYVLGKYVDVEIFNKSKKCLVLLADDVKNNNNDGVVVEKAKRTHAKAIKDILGFYFKLYQLTFKDKPILQVNQINASIKSLLRQGLDQSFIKCCIPIYFNLNDRWLVDNGYPLQNLSRNINKCKNELKEKIKQSGVAEVEYYKYKINEIESQFK